MKMVTSIILIAALAMAIAVVWPSGSYYCFQSACGWFFWGAHEHDAIWHLAIAKHASLSVQQVLPTFAGAALSGYNAMLDLLIAGMAFITRISALTWYFKLIPIIWFLGMVYTWRKFAASYTDQPAYLPALYFFLFFGNSFSYLLRYYHEGHFGGASGLLAMQSPQMLTNIQFALTLPLFGLMLLTIRQDRRRQKDLLLLGGLLFATMGLKFYGGIVMAGMLGAYVLWLAMKNWRLALLSAVIFSLSLGISTLIFYNPFGSTGAQAILSWRPLATIHPIIEESGLAYLPRLATLRYAVQAQGMWAKLIVVEAFTVVIFVILNWGTRLIGIGSWLRRTQNKQERGFHLVLSTGIILGLLMNALLVQRGEWWNTVQFLYYALALTSIYAAETLARLLSGKIWGKLAAALIILATLPNAYDTLRIFASFPPHAYISDKEMTAMQELGKQTAGVTLALPVAPIASTDEVYPRPLYTLYDTAYVAAFSGSQTYLNDIVQLKLTGIDYSARLESVKAYDCRILEQVNYLYVAGPQGQIEPWQKCGQAAIKTIYKNDEAGVYRVILETPNQAR